MPGTLRGIYLPCAAVGLELTVRLTEVLPVRRLAVAVQFFLRAHDRGYSADAAINEMRSALAGFSDGIDDEPTPPSNVIDMESARRRHEARTALELVARHLDEL